MKNKKQNRFDICTVKKRTLSGDKNNPTVYHGMKVPLSIHLRMIAAKNRNVIDILDEHLPK